MIVLTRDKKENEPRQMTRLRVEDLGRIMERSKRLCDDGLFDGRHWLRPKDACEWFGELTDEKKDDVIHDIAYSLQSIHEELLEIYFIACGSDDLNEQDEDR